MPAVSWFRRYCNRSVHWRHFRQSLLVTAASAIARLYAHCVAIVLRCAAITLSLHRRKKHRSVIYVYLSVHVKSIFAARAASARMETCVSREKGACVRMLAHIVRGSSDLRIGQTHIGVPRLVIMAYGWSIKWFGGECICK